KESCNHDPAFQRLLLPGVLDGVGICSLDPAKGLGVATRSLLFTKSDQGAMNGRFGPVFGAALVRSTTFIRCVDVLAVRDQIDKGMHRAQVATIMGPVCL